MKLKYLIIFILITNVFTFAKDINTLDDTIVKSSKQEYKLRDLDMTVNILDQKDIKDEKISNLKDLVGYIPNLSIHNNAEYYSIGIRGITNIGFSVINTNVGLDIDGVYTTDFAGLSYDMMDIESVEVLKGPQGTLYGGHSSGGVISIKTRVPNNTLIRKLGFGLGNNKMMSLGAYLSTPIVQDKFYISLMAKYKKEANPIKNNYLNKNRKDSKMLNTKIHLRTTPTNDLDISLIFNEQNKKFAPLWAYKPGKLNKYEVVEDLESYNKRKIQSTALKVKYYIDSKSYLTYIPNFRMKKINSDLDRDGTNKNIRHSIDKLRRNTLSQELRYNLNTDKTSLLIGTNYKVDKTILDSIDNLKTNKKYNTDIKEKSLGIFTNIKYDLTKKLSLGAGLRYSKDNYSIDDKISKKSAKSKDSDITPKISANYKINKNFITYATIAKGYKPGGYYPYSNLSNKNYKKETLYSYEVGSRLALLNNKLNINTALFMINRKDMQIREYDREKRRSYLLNAGKVKGEGFEIDLKYSSNEYIMYFLNYGYVKSKIKEFNTKSGKNHIGKTTPNTPKYNYSIGTNINYENYYGSLSLIGQGKMYPNIDNKAFQKSYSIINTNLGYKMKNFDFNIYAKNLLNKDTNIDLSTKKYTYIRHTKKREIGFELTYKF